MGKLVHAMHGAVAVGHLVGREAECLWVLHGAAGAGTAQIWELQLCLAGIKVQVGAACLGPGCFPDCDLRGGPGNLGPCWVS